MIFSLKSLGWLVAWLSFLMALFMFAKSEAYARNAYPVGYPSEILLVANFLFSATAISLAIGTYPRRFWITASTISITLVCFQIYDGTLNNAVLALSRRLLILLTDGSASSFSSNGFENHSRELSKLLTYGWTPVVAVFLGALTEWKTERTTKNAG